MIVPVDDKNIEYIKEGIELYKKVRKYIPVSYPVFPTGLIGINERKLASLGLISEKKLLLSVWNLKNEDDDFSIDISKYAVYSEINSVFPHSNTCELKSNIITASMKAMSALYLELDIVK